VPLLCVFDAARPHARRGSKEAFLIPFCYKLMTTRWPGPPSPNLFLDDFFFASLGVTVLGLSPWAGVGSFEPRHPPPSFLSPLVLPSCGLLFLGVVESRTTLNPVLFLLSKLSARLGVTYPFNKAPNPNHLTKPYPSPLSLPLGSLLTLPLVFDIVFPSSFSFAW